MSIKEITIFKIMFQIRTLWKGIGSYLALTDGWYFIVPLLKVY